ncbi:hypothetical protein IL992_10745 [Microbispora sp. NEAU-D428]|uniref:TolB family protein n=1 Tax=Microbispora sitophila TaxID=2771537 RepID=UPI00186937E3|nr:hypothetical protein [Microbispora sitophila]MBE3009668.1 hypothetical protein [Microbispora sitophila]
MNLKSVATFAVAATVTAMLGTQPASSHTQGTPRSSAPRASAQSITSGPWVKLAGTSAKLNDVPGGPVRLASYSLIFDAGQGHYGYLREGDRFVRTPYREALVAPGERWVAGIPDSRLWLAVKRIDLIDRTSGRKYTIPMPAPVTSPEWSPDGSTLLLTAYKPRRDGSLTIIGFITLTVTDRTPRLVETGPRHRVADWDIGRSFRFYFTGGADGVLAMHDERDVAPRKRRIAVYDLDGKRRRVYTGVGDLDEWHTVTPFSPSGRLFATFVREGENGHQIGIVEASTGKVVHRIGKDIHAFAGWYDEKHVIVQRKRAETQVVYQRADLSGTVDLELIREKLIAGPAEYKPHLDRVNFVHRD